MGLTPEMLHSRPTHFSFFDPAHFMQSVMRMFEHHNKIFDAASPSLSFHASASSPHEPVRIPAFDVLERPDIFVLEGDFPGVVDRNDFTIEWIGDRTLHVEAKITHIPRPGSPGEPAESSSKPQQPQQHHRPDKEDFGSPLRRESDIGKPDDEVEKPKWWLRERAGNVYRRSFAFPSPVESEKVEAKFENSVLRIKVHKKPLTRTESRRIVPVQ